MPNTLKDQELSHDYNEEKAKEIAQNYFTLISNYQFEDAKKLLAANFTLTGLSAVMTREDINELFESEFCNSKKYIYDKKVLSVQKLSSYLYLLLLPVTVSVDPGISIRIISSVVVNIKISKIVAVTIPLEHSGDDYNQFQVGSIRFILDDKLTIVSIDKGITKFLSFQSTEKYLISCNNSLLNSVQTNKNALLDLLETNGKMSTLFVTHVKLKNKIGELIEVLFGVKSYSNRGSHVEVEATIRDSMGLGDYKTPDNKRFSRLTSILQNSPAPFFYKDVSGRFLGLNNAFLKLFGEDEYFNVIGKTDYQLLPKETADLHRAEDLKVINERISITRNSVNDAGTDILSNYQYTKSPLIENDVVVGIICFLNDVSPIYNLNNELIKFQSEMSFIFNSSKLAYFVKDENLRYKRVNKTFLRNITFSRTPILGKTNEELNSQYGYNFLNFTEQEKEILKTKKPFSISQFLTNANGKKQYYTITESPLLDDNNNATGIVGSIENITVLVERQLRLESKYKSTIQLISDDDFLAFVRVDIDLSKIVELKSLHDGELESTTILNDKLLEYFMQKMVYEKEIEEAKRLFSIDNLKASFSPEGKISREYSYKPDNNRLKVASVELAYNINPSNNHKEVFFHAFDVTKTYLQNEVVNSITQRGYDFIIKINLLLDMCEFIMFDKKKYPFVEYNSLVSINKVIDILFHNFVVDRPSRDTAINSIKNKLKKNRECTFFYDTNDGRRKSLVVKNLNKEKYTYLLTLTDITEMTKQYKVLQDKLEKSVNEAEKANKIKTDFLAKMSHDMRTPLNGIMGIADFGFDESNQSEIREYFSNIKLSSSYLLTLLNDVLDMQSIEKGSVRIFNKPIKTMDLINSIVAIVNQAARKKNIILNTILPQSGPEYISIDSVRVSQVLINILNNSIKYTGENGEINYIIEYIGGEDCVFKSVISDNGVGMSKKFQKHMFESFTTEINKYSSVEGGTGLGLAISNSLVQLMGGKIECESKLNVGTKFTIFLPSIAITKEEYLKTAGSENLTNISDLKGKKVLVCEDNKINTMIITKLLSEKGILVDTAENGKIGVEKTKINDYDLIFMDIKMPVMDGLSAATLIRKMNKKVPIIALSANAYKEDVVKSISSGMNEHLPKPIDKKDLFITLRKYL